MGRRGESGIVGFFHWHFYLHKRPLPRSGLHPQVAADLLGALAHKPHTEMTLAGRLGSIVSSSIILLTGYATARPRAFGGKWVVERLIGWGMAAPALFDRAIGRLEARGWSHTPVGVTGDFVPTRQVLDPRFLAGMLW